MVLFTFGSHICHHHHHLFQSHDSVVRWSCNVAQSVDRISSALRCQLVRLDWRPFLFKRDLITPVKTFPWTPPRSTRSFDFSPLLFHCLHPCSSSLGSFFILLIAHYFRWQSAPAWPVCCLINLVLWAAHLVLGLRLLVLGLRHLVLLG